MLNKINGFFHLYNTFWDTLYLQFPFYSREQIQILLDNGLGYRCFCTDRRLNLLRKEAIRKQEIPKYDNRCRHLSSEEIKKNLDEEKPSCIRFKVGNAI